MNQQLRDAAQALLTATDDAVRVTPAQVEAAANLRAALSTPPPPAEEALRVFIPSEVQIGKHATRAGDCPPDSIVMLVRSIRELQDRANQNRDAVSTPLPAEEAVKELMRLVTVAIEQDRALQVGLRIRPASDVTRMRSDAVGCAVDAIEAHARQMLLSAQEDARGRLPSVEALEEVIVGGLFGAYHCTRVWDAWNVGTMSRDDFHSVADSETPRELAEGVRALLDAAMKQEKP